MTSKKKPLQLKKRAIRRIDNAQLSKAKGGTDWSDGCSGWVDTAACYTDGCEDEPATAEKCYGGGSYSFRSPQNHNQRLIRA